MRPITCCAAQNVYKTFILVPYAIAPAIAGIVWAFLFNPAVGPVALLLHAVGVSWDPVRFPGHAMTLVVLASAWKQVSYNFLFLIAGLLAVPRSILEAAAVDGAGPVRRFVSIALPMLTPTLFFLIVVNFVYGFFETLRSWTRRRAEDRRARPRSWSTRSTSMVSSRSISAHPPRNRSS